MFPSSENVEAFSRFLYKIRTFFHQKGFWEVETPLLNSYATTEPYIDSYQVISDPNLYLITSPELNLKILLSYYKKNIFQIAHVFRRELGRSFYHKNEFLMLEWYHLHCDEFQLMNEVEELLFYISQEKSFSPIEECKRFSMTEIFEIYLNSDFSRNSLVEIIKKNQLLEKKKFSDLNNYSYDDLFFLVFLNLIEPKLETENPLFIYHYPEELRAYSKVQSSVARRFELYWKGLEIANGYYEIQEKEEQIQVLKKEAKRRIDLHKPVFPMSREFLNSFPLPECSGVSIGLERLFMAFRNLKSIDEISFTEKLT